MSQNGVSAIGEGPTIIREWNGRNEGEEDGKKTDVRNKYTGLRKKIGTHLNFVQYYNMQLCLGQCSLV